VLLKIIESFEFKRTFKGHLLQLLYNEQGHPQIDQVAQSLIHPGLESLQGQGTPYLSELPAPVHHYPYNHFFFLKKEKVKKEQKAFLEIY